jgi:hypothetical protein
MAAKNSCEKFKAWLMDGEAGSLGCISYHVAVLFGEHKQMVDN